MKAIYGIGFAEAVEQLIGAPATSASRSELRAQATLQVGGNQDEHDRRQHCKAAWLWSRRRPISGSIAEIYLREARGFTGLLPPTLGFLPAWRDHPPAMIAAYSLPLEIEPGILAAPALDPADAAVHITRLQPDGSDRQRGEDAKITIGRPLGRPIVIAPLNDMLGLAASEGVEDALTMYQVTGLGAWAAGSAPYMPPLAAAVPAYTEAVTIYAHDDDGRRYALKLAQAIHQRGIEVATEGLP